VTPTLPHVFKPHRTRFSLALTCTLPSIIRRTLPGTRVCHPGLRLTGTIISQATVGDTDYIPREVTIARRQHRPTLP
ncbi:MAG: hypothetical protein ACRDRT_11625, partial [Pseudonocardiaceae bacterium]